MKKLIGAALFLVACHGGVQHQAPGPQAPGAATPREAMAALFAAVNVPDLQGISAVWGTSTGLAREDLDIKTLEEREMFMIKCLRNDRYVVNSEASGTTGSRVLTIAVTRGSLTRIGEFST